MPNWEVNSKGKGGAIQLQSEQSVDFCRLFTTKALQKL